MKLSGIEVLQVVDTITTLKDIEKITDSLLKCAELLRKIDQKKSCELLEVLSFLEKCIFNAIYSYTENKVEKALELLAKVMDSDQRKVLEALAKEDPRLNAFIYEVFSILNLCRDMAETAIRRCFRYEKCRNKHFRVEA